MKLNGKAIPLFMCIVLFVCAVSFGVQTYAQGSVSPSNTVKTTNVPTLSASPSASDAPAGTNTKKPTGTPTTAGTPANTAAPTITPKPGTSGTKYIGIVSTTNTELNVRKGPGIEYDKVGKLSKGAIINVLDTALDTNKDEWFKISTDDISGYVMQKYITLVPVSEAEDKDFETSIAKFPESYKEKLRDLHAIYPSWKFIPLETGLTWETLMKNECVIGRNLLQSPEAWLSFEDGAYNFKNSSWYSFDSGNWRQACKEVIAYYLDPRNFLDENIYQFLVVSDDGGEYDADGINEILKGTFMYDAPCGKDGTYAEALVKAGKEAGASPYLLAARIKMEQGANGNKLAHGTVPGYEGYYNHFDIGAYAHDGRSAIVNGAIYAKNEKRNWNTPYKAILGGAQFLVKNYIGVGQNTLYLQKYDVVDGGNGLYGHQYMTNVVAAVSEAATLRNAIVNANATTSQLSFLIPVYIDMPEDYGTLPLKTGNANNLLESLTVEGGKVTQAFDKYTFDYDVFTQETQIKITAKAMDSGAKIKGTGTVNLKEGVNEIPITVTASNGLKRVYTLHISSSGEKGFTTNYKTKDNLLLGINAGTTIEKFAKEVTVAGYVVKYLDSKGNEKKATDIMKTGDKISLVYEGKEERTLEIVIYGDSNGDGKISSVDLLKTQKAILGLSKFESAAYSEAADYSKDGKVNSKDLLACQKKILGLE